MCWQNLPPSRARSIAGALLTLVVLGGAVAGCSGSTGQRSGAPTGGTRTGPKVLAQPTLPPLAARRTTSTTTGSAPLLDTKLQRLSNAIDEALTEPDRVTPASSVGQKAAAGDQVRIEWTVDTQLPDPGAPHRVRVDAIKILRLVQQSGIKYGSVLLLATGVVLEKGTKTVSVVVRAKYTRRLVHDTDWTKVTTAEILKLPDDKPAVITPSYR